MKTATFDFEALHVYQKGLDLAMKVLEWVDRSSNRSQILGVLEEKALLLPQLIAEGNTYGGDFVKAQAMRRARGQCYQWVPLLEMARKKEALSQTAWECFYEAIQELTKMLGNLVFSLEQAEERGCRRSKGL